jgi:hypothetical protein
MRVNEGARWHAPFRFRQADLVNGRSPRNHTMQGVSKQVGSMQGWLASETEGVSRSS